MNNMLFLIKLTERNIIVGQYIPNLKLISQDYDINRVMVFNNIEQPALENAQAEFPHVFAHKKILLVQSSRCFSFEAVYQYYNKFAKRSQALF